MQGLGGAPGAGHQHADLGKRRLCLQSELGDGDLHVFQVGATMACLVLAQAGVDVLDHRFIVPLAGPPIPVVQPHFTAEVQHQGLQGGSRIKLEAHGMQFRLGRLQLRAKAAQVLHQDQGVFLLFKKPDRHEGRKVAVVPVVTQEHFGGWQRRPLGNGVEPDGLRLLIGQA